VLARGDVLYVDLRSSDLFIFVFFFQAEDGIRDLTVTGVQTCALPICSRDGYWLLREGGLRPISLISGRNCHSAIGRGNGRWASSWRSCGDWFVVASFFVVTGDLGAHYRSEERRVGKECGQRSWLPAGA